MKVKMASFTPLRGKRTKKPVKVRKIVIFHLCTRLIYVILHFCLINGSFSYGCLTVLYNQDVFFN